MSSNRKVTEREFDGHTVVTTELDFLTSADLVPELAAIWAPGVAAAAGQGATMGDAIGAMAKALSGGKLVALLPRILVGTIVTTRDADGTLTKHDLSKGREKINTAFTGRKKLAIQVVQLVVEVNFMDFLDGLDLSGQGAQTP